MKTKADKAAVQKAVRAHAKATVELSDAIARLAEPGFEEFESARLTMEYLAERGFYVETPWRRMPTAFRAVRGKGKPAIGVLGEYDALPDCGPREGQWGHGCGHNLLGAGAAAGAAAAADLLEARDWAGRVVYYGCPAEEILAGKIYMARDGAFRDCDAILGWHPGRETAVGRCGGSALDSLLFEFRGKTAHGAYADKGRSALDGAILMDIAANYLREHVPDNVRIHMCLPEGGNAPNVVPAYARAWYYVRGKDRAQVDEVAARLKACARGAAQATGTRVGITLLTAGYNRLRNEAMGDAVGENLALFGAPRPTRRDKANVEALGKEPVFDSSVTVAAGEPGKASSDEDAVSWLAPFGRFSVVCQSKKDITGHHRETAAQMTLPFAHRGMLRAAEVFAATICDLCADRRLLARARSEFRAKTKDFAYDPLVPKRQKPPGARL